ncbi:MAG: hypothetical protein K6G68_02300 [Oscillospiraceae bacterium]|nr:hypothetical protein [Oscillospiraceae bacterium]
MEISNNDMCDILVGEYGRKANAHLYEKEPAVGCFDEYGYDMLKALIQHTSALLDDDMYESTYLMADILHVLPDVLIPGKKKIKTGILQGSSRALCRKNRGQYF